MGDTTEHISVLGKRDRNDDLGVLVDDVLRQERDKKAKDKVKKKAVTIDESQNVEHIIPADPPADDDGPIKEHLVDIAHQTRQNTRKKHSQDVLEAFEGGGEVEEDQELEELDGHKLEAFNMNEERQHGYIDEDGAFVEKKDKDEEELRKDAWLSSMEVVSDEVKEKIKQREVQAANDEPISDEQVGEAKAVLVGLMEARETVMQALTRLSSRPKGQKAKPRVGRQELTPEERQRKEIIERLTDAASTVMAAGETDIYDQRKEELEHACTLLLPLAAAERSAANGSADGGNDEGEDMFADTDDEDQQQEKPHTAPESTPAEREPQASATAAPAVVAPDLGPSVAAPASEPSVDYSEWPISELRRVLTEAGIDVSTFTEKAELIAKMHELDSSKAERQVPPGFVLEPNSGYFFHLESGMYYDAQSGYYFKDGQWLSYDHATGQYVMVPVS